MPSLRIRKGQEAERGNPAQRLPQCEREHAHDAGHRHVWFVHMPRRQHHTSGAQIAGGKGEKKQKSKETCVPKYNRQRITAIISGGDVAK